MLRFALSRIVMAVPTLLIVAVAVFVMIRLIPGDPAQLLLGDLATPAALADLRARLGLDQTWLTQFGIWFGNMLHGDLGSSINTGQPQACTQVRQRGRRRQVAQQQLGGVARDQPDHHEHRHRHDQQGRHGHDNSG